MQSVNEVAQQLFSKLREKKEITAEDIIAIYNVTPSVAYAIFTVLKVMCQQHQGECQAIKRGRKTVIVSKQ
ncbi:hypothetical protein ATV_gp07 [Bicaudavirus pozzuoliense]|uniref:Uncharacterized protein ORF70 n=2 Tax=Acidianus two-tailed virus TaxID=315953 RepID=Y070_ATV|nr:hypothetical protein ATV_gp07 [Acidianus two-tailed virus]Q3V4T1.1 RecName: Full=Uncharacterized protein ORF70 [Acidianus two-tailed virus]AON96487.1 hypothetical protein [Acidianus two-tailed phage variant 1]CAI59883.1 hypothetical protein [Acidianus two-tailed virus]